MKKLLLLTATLLFSFCTASTSHASTATTPVSRSKNEVWQKRHLGQVEIAQSRTDCSVLFLGDSITHHWRGKGKETWDRYYAPIDAINFGISGDRTQHLLWRLQNGEIGTLKPKVIVMMIGTNNIGFEKKSQLQRNQTSDIANGISLIIDELRTQLPESKILLLGVFPRGKQDSFERHQVAALNTLIKPMADEEHVFYQDISQVFLSSDGILSPEIMPDLLHPNAHGYVLWAEAMQETLNRPLNNDSSR